VLRFEAASEGVEMSPYFRELRERLPHLHHHGPQGGTTHPERAANGNDELPVPGYDMLGERDLVHDLHHHSQAELAEIEEYERTHENRPAVIHKLHYLRGPEPWRDYDEMGSDEIVARLENADDNTIKRVRDYEHKFRNRPAIVDRAIELHHHWVETHPRPPAPGYVPGGAARQH
jgi:hypothetical protein